MRPGIRGAGAGSPGFLPLPPGPRGEAAGAAPFIHLIVRGSRELVPLECKEDRFRKMISSLGPG